MKIDVLYFDGCPNHKPAIELVQEVLKDEGVAAHVSEVHVRDQVTAEVMRFLGSPSIRVNGVDVEPAARSADEYGMMCRTYLVDGRREGLPSREMIRQAVREANSRTPSAEDCCHPPGADAAGGEKPTNAQLFAVGSVFAAVVASFCCILPIVFALAGVSIVGASALFAAWRPYLLGLTCGLLALGFYFAYRPRKNCAPGSACAMPAAKQSGRLMLWALSGAATLFASFPYYSAPAAEVLLSRGSVTPSQPAPPVEHAAFGIEGMDCPACATAVETKLNSVPGVLKATVRFEEKRADVEYDANSASLPQLERVIEAAGYSIRRGQ